MPRGGAGGGEEEEEERTYKTASAEETQPGGTRIKVPRFSQRRLVFFLADPRKKESGKLHLGAVCSMFDSQK